MKFANLFLTASLSIAMAFVLSCSDGRDGEDGTSCVALPKESAADGFDIICGGEKVGEISNEKSQCLLDVTVSGRVNIICNDERVGTLVGGSAGIQGEQGESGDVGEKGDQGASCDIEDYGAYLVIKCGGEEKARSPKATCGATAYNPEEMTCSKDILSFNFIDSRDNKKYKAVIIGTQTWMAENLNYSDDGELGICYKEEDSNCAKYGRLYDWETAKTVCPVGWYLPSNDEWAILFNFVGGNSVAGSMLKATSGWDNYEQSVKSSVYINAEIGYRDVYIDVPTSGNGIDDYNFSALPGGYAYPYYSSKVSLGIGGWSYWWTSVEVESNTAILRYIKNSSVQVETDIYNKNRWLSVRCLKEVSL